MASEKARLLRQSSTDAERGFGRRCVLGSLRTTNFAANDRLVRSSLISFALSICWSLSWMEVSTADSDYEYRPYGVAAAAMAGACYAFGKMTFC